MVVKMSLNCHIGMNQSLNKNMSVYKDKIGEIWKKIKGQCQDFMSGCPAVPGYVQLSPKIEAGETRIQFHNTWFPDGNPL